MHLESAGSNFCLATFDWGYKMSPKIAVIYLARLADGFINFKNFADSYRKHPSGRQHDLILLAKGFQKPGEYAALQATFSGLPHKLIAVRDDIGLDLHAYRAAAKQLNHSHALFFKTFAEIASDYWLDKMAANCLAENVGAVGAFGSFESLYDSAKVLSKVKYLTTNKTLIRSLTNLLRPTL